MNSFWRSLPLDSESWQNAGHFKHKRLSVLVYSFSSLKSPEPWKSSIHEYNNKDRTLELRSLLRDQWMKTKSKQIKSFLYEKQFLHCSELSLIFPQQALSFEISDHKSAFISRISKFYYKLYPLKFIYYCLRVRSNVSITKVN